MKALIRPIALIGLLMGFVHADFSIDFNTNIESWVKDNRNDGQTNPNLVHSSQERTNAECLMSDIPQSPNGDFIMSDDMEGGLMFFENTDPLNQDISNLLNGHLSFDWINQTYDGTRDPESNSNEMQVTLTGSDLTVETTFNGRDLVNHGWNTIEIPLTTNKWGSQLQQVLANLTKIEIRVEAIAHGATGWSEKCVDNEYYGIDSIKFTAPNNSVGEAYHDEDGKKYTKFLHFADELKDTNQTSNRLLTIDYEKMELIKSVDVPGDLNHHVDVMGHNHNAEYMMMVPKGSEFVEFRHVKDGAFVKRIDLTRELGTTFKPRSADAYNPTHNLILLTAANRPAGVVIDADSLEIVGKAGLNIDCNKADEDDGDIIHNPDSFGNVDDCKAPDFGGSQITGHPLWINSNHFAIVDRTNRRVHVYKIEQNSDKTTWTTTRIDTVKTNTSLHQLLALNPEDPNNAVVYGLTEGTKLVKKPTITVSDENPNIAEFTLGTDYDIIADISFPTDAFGGLNQLIIEEKATGKKAMNQKGFADHTGIVTPRSDHNSNRYDYRVGYPNEYLYRKYLYNRDKKKKYIYNENDVRTPKEYIVYSLSYANYEDYRAKRNPTYNQLKIVENEIRFNNPRSEGVVGGEARTMDNLLYDDAQLLLAERKPFNDNGSPVTHIGSELYHFELAGNRFDIKQVIQLKSGNDRGFFGHNLYMTPDKEYLYTPVGLSYDNGPHGIPFNGGLFMVDREEFKIKRWHKTGKGAGHVSFSKKYNVAVLTHHGEHYVTLFDMRTKHKIKDISLEQKKKSYSLVTQSHAPFIDGDYFYNAWVDGGTFVRIDLRRQILDSYLEIFTLRTGGMPIQGNFFNRKQ